MNKCKLNRCKLNDVIVLPFVLFVPSVTILLLKRFSCRDCGGSVCDSDALITFDAILFFLN